MTRKNVFSLASTVLVALFTTSAIAVTEPVGSNLQQSPENVAPAFNNELRESQLAALNYVNQPPTIPHGVNTYQVNKNVNQCLNCHSVEASRVTGATRVSPTHFADRDGKLSSNVSPGRYFCLQCHVSQTDVEPIVPNEFKPAKGYSTN